MPEGALMPHSTILSSVSRAMGWSVYCRMERRAMMFSITIAAVSTCDAVASLVAQLLLQDVIDSSANEPARMDVSFIGIYVLVFRIQK